MSTQTTNVFSVVILNHLGNGDTFFQPIGNDHATLEKAISDATELQQEGSDVYIIPMMKLNP